MELVRVLGENVGLVVMRDGVGCGVMATQGEMKLSAVGVAVVMTKSVLTVVESACW